MLFLCRLKLNDMKKYICAFILGTASTAVDSDPIVYPVRFSMFMQFDSESWYFIHASILALILKCWGVVYSQSEGLMAKGS
jgi:hypothetical protein